MSPKEALNYINIAHFFDHYFLLIFPTAVLAISPAWGMDFSEVLLLGTPLYFAFALGTLPAGWLGDRLDRVMLIGIFFVGCGCSSLWISIAASPIELSVGLGALGLFAAIYHPVGLAHITQIGLRTGRALAVNGVYGNMGLAGAAIATGYFASRFGWQSAFAVPGVISVLIGGILLYRNKGTSTEVTKTAIGRQREKMAFERSVQVKVFSIICVSALFGGMIFNIVTISLPKYFDVLFADVGADLVWVGASAGVIFAAAAFAQLPVGELLDRVGARPILLYLLSGQMLMFLLLTQATQWLAYAGTLILVILIFAQIPVTSWLIGKYLDVGIRSRALSVEYVLSLGVGSCAVPLISFLQREEIGFEVQFAGLAVAALITFAAASQLPGIGSEERETQSAKA
ncbi:MAG: MFS transporter [Pseudomonadota bacterium]